MNEHLVVLVTYFVLAIFVGFEVISKVPTILHTPLMSGTNAIHGIILVGALVIAAGAQTPLQVALGFVAVLLATINVVGGFVVTDRMLEMFRARRHGPEPHAPGRHGPEPHAPAHPVPGGRAPQAGDR